MATVKTILLSTALVMSLSACASTPWREFNTGDPAGVKTDKEQILASARKATMEKKYEAVRNGDLDAAEEAYKASPDDAYAALSYAKILRQVNMIEQADMVLKPFAEDPAQAGEDVLVEYAKIKLVMGEFDVAQMMAQEASFINENPNSLMVLGIALDAQGHHTAAEEQLRKALDGVGMDIALKNKIMNNLAVSLISQGRRNEAALVLSQIQDAGGANVQIIEANRKLAEQL